MTGRLARWGAEVEAIELDRLSADTAAGFLVARTAEQRRATPKDAEALGKSATELEATLAGLGGSVSAGLSP